MNSLNLALENILGQKRVCLKNMHMAVNLIMNSSHGYSRHGLEKEMQTHRGAVYLLCVYCF